MLTKLAVFTVWDQEIDLWTVFSLEWCRCSIRTQIDRQTVGLIQINGLQFPENLSIWQMSETMSNHTDMNCRLLNWKTWDDQISMKFQVTPENLAYFENLAHLAQIVDNLDWFFLQLLRMIPTKVGSNKLNNSLKFNWDGNHQIPWKPAKMEIVRYPEIHHHHINVHFLPRSIKGIDGCFPTA